MDERAFGCLKVAPPEVQERVFDTFIASGVLSDYSRAVTAHVQFCLKEHREPDDSAGSEREWADVDPSDHDEDGEEESDNDGSEFSGLGESETESFAAELKEGVFLLLRLGHGGARGSRLWADDALNCLYWTETEGRVELQTPLLEVEGVWMESSPCTVVVALARAPEWRFVLEYEHEAIRLVLGLRAVVDWRCGGSGR